MERCFLPEIMDGPGLPDDVVAEVQRNLARVHRCLGNTRAILTAIARDPMPVVTVMDLGCGDGALLARVRDRLRKQVIGLDLRSPPRPEIPVVRADVVRDELPKSDVAVAVVVAHHLRDDDVILMIRNVGRSCRRLILLELVRHPLPLALFRTFVTPWVDPITASDGMRSIRRAYTPAEFRALVARALAGTPARFSHRVAPLYMRQIVDITYSC
ncbi:MAG: methyltransferase [Bryobacteraceae bacterium]